MVRDRQRTGDLPREPGTPVRTVLRGTPRPEPSPGGRRARAAASARHRPGAWRIDRGPKPAGPWKYVHLGRPGGRTAPGGVMRILVVDDEPDVVESVRLGFMLQWRDVEVLGAGEGDG